MKEREGKVVERMGKGRTRTRTRTRRYVGLQLDLEGSRTCGALIRLMV